MRVGLIDGGVGMVVEHAERADGAGGKLLVDGVLRSWLLVREQREDARMRHVESRWRHARLSDDPSCECHFC